MRITKKWFRCAAIRALKTFAQSMLSMLTIGQAFWEVDWAGILSVAAVAAIISMLTSVAGLPEVEEQHEAPVDNPEKG